MDPVGWNLTGFLTDFQVILFLDLQHAEGLMIHVDVIFALFSQVTTNTGCLHVNVIPLNVHDQVWWHEIDLSNEKRAPGCLVYIGDGILHSYIGIISINHEIPSLKLT